VAFDMQTRPQYDFPTAVIFLIAGLGLGSVLTLLFAPRSERPTLVPSSARRSKGASQQSSAL
jgi:hypothetical protein